MNNKNTLSKAILLALTLSAVNALAADADKAAAQPDQAADAEMQSLLAILDEQTEIATKTKLNADYVPGMVTVLKGDEMAARGMKTVAEALGQVAGIDSRMDRQMTPKLVVRGTGEAFASGNIKYQVNGMDLTESNSGYSPILNLPIANVERIDVIRGPGSAIYGEFAFTGVVNVITRREESQAYVSAGQNEQLGAGGTLSFSDPERDLSVNLNVSAWQDTGRGVRTGTDILYGLYPYTYGALVLPPAYDPAHTFVQDGAYDLVQNPALTSNAPGYSHEQRKNRNLSLDAHFAGTGLNLQYFKDEKGDGFGIVNALSDVDKITHRDSYLSMGLTHDFELTQQLSSTVKASLLSHEGDYDVQAFPSNFVLMEDDYICQAFGGIPGVCPTPLGDIDASPDVIIIPEGFLGVGHTEEIRRQLGIDFTWTPHKQHKILLAVEGAWVDLVEAWEENNLNLATNEYTDGSFVRQPRREAGSERDIFSVTLQDEFRITENLDLTVGVRGDDYSDVGENISPRLAAVWRPYQHHIIKAQYAEAFRPPTFWEAAREEAGKELKSQTIETYELAYIYRDIDKVMRATLYKSDLQNLITEDSLLDYVNQPGVEQKGAEFEIEARLSRQLKLDANVAYLDVMPKPGSTSIYGYNDWQGQAGMAYQPMNGVTLYGQLKYISDFYREAIDARKKLQGYTTADITLSVVDVIATGAALRMGVKNVTDAEVKLPAPYAQDPLGNKYPTYVDDYPRPGRMWWLEFGYNF